jgi:hypothetical protein
VLISLVGHREDEGHNLVSATAAATYEWAWRREVAAATPESLVHEGELLRVLAVAQREGEAEGVPIVVPDNPEITLTLLCSARSEIRSQSIDSRSVNGLLPRPGSS